MADVPSFAAALLARRHPDSPSARTFSGRNPFPTAAFRSPEELALRSQISDLEEQISILSIQASEIPHLKSRVESEQQRSSDLARQCESLEVSLAEEDTKTESLNEQITQLQFLLTSKQSLIDSKEAIIIRLQEEYPALQEQYEQALDIFTEEVRQPIIYTPPRHTQLDPPFTDSDWLIDPEPVQLFEPPVLDRSQPVPARSQPVIDRSPPVSDRSQSVVDRSQSVGAREPELRMFTRPVVQSPIHRALQDNIRFGDEPDRSPPSIGKSVDMRPTNEVRTELTMLQAEKEHLESELTRSFPKNITNAEAKRTRALISEQLVSVIQKLNELRLEIRRRSSP